MRTDKDEIARLKAEVVILQGRIVPKSELVPSNENFGAGSLRIKCLMKELDALKAELLIAKNKIAKMEKKDESLSAILLEVERLKAENSRLAEMVRWMPEA